MTRLTFSLLNLGLAIGVLAAGPAYAYEYGWLVGGLGPRKPTLTPSASRSAGHGVWASIASASAYRSGAGAGPWRTLVARSVAPKTAPTPDVSGGATAKPAAPREASPPSPAAGASAKGSTPPRR